MKISRSPKQSIPPSTCGMGVPPVQYIFCGMGVSPVQALSQSRAASIPIARKMLSKGFGN
ncbi:hypothetical protein [Microcoleus sp. CAWBG58]|uniref:hypothetical protein n=1 Tax=Microcoleus sp. CAWBG58 TaxID=2841651 RepID=UPI0025FDE29A|nr:hypothetical protein [Microcoleus sp. CAWBG58]